MVLIVLRGCPCDIAMIQNNCSVTPETCVWVYMSTLYVMRMDVHHSTILYAYSRSFVTLYYMSIHARRYNTICVFMHVVTLYYMRMDLHRNTMHYARARPHVYGNVAVTHSRGAPVQLLATLRGRSGFNTVRSYGLAGPPLCPLLSYH